MVRNPLGSGRIGQKKFLGEGRPESFFFWSRLNWLKFFQDCTGLVRMFSGESRIGQNSFDTGQDWSDFFLGVGRIGQNSFRNGQD